MKYLSIALIVLALCLTGASAEAGIKLAITPKGFNDFATQFLPQFLKQITPITMPDFQASGYKMSKGVIEGLSLDGKATQITFDEGRGAFKTTNFGLKLSFFLEGNVLGFIPIHFQTGGVSNRSELTFDVSFGYKDQFVQIKINKLDLSIRNLQMHFPDDTLGKIASEIMNALAGPIESVLNLVVSTLLKGTLQNVINNALTMIPKEGPLPGTPFGIEYQATHAPVVNSKYLASHINATIYNMAAGFMIPHVAPAVATPEFDAKSGAAFQAVITEYTLNTALDAFWRTKTLFYNVTQSVIPPEAGLKLTVGWLKQFIPTLSQYYSNDKWELIVLANVTKAPVLKIVPGDIGADVGVTLTFYVNATHSNITKCVTVTSTLSVHANLSISNWTVKPYIISGAFGNFIVVKSNVGDFNPAKFQQGLNILLLFGLPGFNAAKPTFPLPAVPGVKLQSLFVNIRPGYVQVEVTPVYSTFNFNELIQNKHFTLADFTYPSDEAAFAKVQVIHEDNEFLPY